MTVRIIFSALLLASLMRAGWAQPSAVPSNLVDSYYHFSLAKMHHFNEEYGRAVQEFERALNLNPESPTVRIEFAETLLQMNQPSRAIELIQQAIEIDPESSEAHLALGIIYFGMREQDGMRELALTQFTEALALDPDQPEALQYAADLNFQLGRFGEAAGLFGRLRKLNPSSIRAHYFEAQALIELREFDRAMTVLEDGLSIRDDIPDYILMLARLYQGEGEWEKAEALFRRALENGPEPRLNEGLARTLVMLGKGEEAVPILERMAEIFPAESEIRLDLARAYRLSNRLEQAAETLEKLQAVDPDDVWVNYEYASVMILMGEREKAAATLERLLDSELPRARSLRPNFLTNLAFIRQDEGDYEQAVEILEKVLAGAPRDPGAQLRLFYAYQKADRTSEMLNLSEKMIEQDPDSPDVVVARSEAIAASGRLEDAVGFLQRRMVDSQDPERLYLAASQLYLVREKLEQAREVVEHGLEEFADSERLRFQLAAIMERQQRYQAAEEQFKQLLEENPDHADVLNYLGYMLAERGERLSEALEYTTRAVELDPYNGAYLDSLGWVYFQQEDLENAEIHLKKAVQLQRTDPVILEHLGDLYTRKGNLAEARRYYELSLQHAEKPEETQRVKKKLERLVASVSGS